MLVRSLCKVKWTAFWPIFCLLLIACFETSWSAESWDQTAIVEAYLGTDSGDRSLAQSMAEQARERGSAARNSHNADLGPLVKLWCDAAAIAPNPENLAECAQFHFRAVDQMSNPQPSQAVVRTQRATESLVMIRAAMEIAGGDPTVSEVFRYRLKNYAGCFRSIISGVSANMDCWDKGSGSSSFPGSE